MFVGLDAALAWLLLQAAGNAWVGLAVAIGAVVLFLIHQGAGSEIARLALLGAILTLLFLLPQLLLLLTRAPDAPVQDGLLITQAAADRLLAGQDPYGHDYLDSAALRAFYLPEIPVNPLLGHFVYPPGAVLVAVPFRLLGIGIGWLWLLGMPLLALAAYGAAGRAGVVAVALNPLLLLDTVYLFNDLFFLAAALGSVALLRRRRVVAAGLLLAAALSMKQLAIVFVPLVAFEAARSLQAAQLRSLAAAAAGALLLLGAPFVAWGAPAFMGDTAAYFYSSGLQSFPIRGPGLPGLLLQAGVIPSRWSSYPAAALQAIPVLVLLVLAARDLRLRFTWARAWAWLAAMTAVLFLFGRTLAPNYVTLVVILLTLALALRLEDGAPADSAIEGGVDGAAGLRRV